MSECEYDQNPKRPKGRLRLGEILIQSGQIDVETLHHALKICKREKKKIGQVLIETGKIDEIEMAKTLAEQLDIPFVRLDDTRTIPEEVLALIPSETARKYGVVPVKRKHNVLTVAYADPLKAFCVDDVSFITGMQVQAAVCTGSDIDRALERYYPIQVFTEYFEKGGLEKSGLEVLERQEEKKEAEQDLMNLAKLPPVVRLTNMILAESIRLGASDIHVEPQKECLLVRCRIDGVMRETLRIERHAHPPLVSRMKIISGLDISIHRKPQDGKAQIRYGGKIYDLRISTLPTSYGEKVTLRILDPDKARLQPTDLGFNSSDLEKVLQSIHRPQGLVLVTGPTGSGKSSTLYAFLNRLNTTEVNIVTVEDPVEFDVAGINQVQINVQSGMSFAAGLRSILRQDPDIVMVGEIRDQETAEIAFQAAQTGHMVFSTLHTNDAPSAITRLQDLGIENFHIANSLVAVIAQRLVRTIHEDCKVPAKLTQMLSKSLADILQKQEPDAFWEGSGCEGCQGWGTLGRTGLFEVLQITTALSHAISAKSSLDEIVATAAGEGYGTMFEDGIQKALDGRIPVTEVFRATSPPGMDQLAAKDAPAPQEAEPSPGSEAYRILLAEDEETTAWMIQKILTTNGYRVSVVSNGKQALEALEEEVPDLLITDYLMPELDGIELIRSLRSSDRFARIPVLMLTARDEVETEVEAIGAGADEYLTKPVKSGRLLARVGRFFRQRRKILVVEDKLVTARFIQRILQGAGYAVDRATDGKDALDSIAKFLPDLIITDYMMPEMDGIALIRELKSNTRTESIPVIMLTARAEEAVEIRAIKYGADDYIVKPIISKKLIARVEKIFRLRQPRATSAR